MSEMPLQPERPPQSKSAELQDRLLSGQLPPEDFLEEIFQIDQSTPGRENAWNNLTVLNDARIRRIFENNTDLRWVYFNTLSLSHFHVGQLLAIEGNFEEAKKHFGSALSAAEEITEPDYQDWKFYIEATVAYLNGDRSKLYSTYLKMDEDTNKYVVDRFIKGLEKRGFPNYEIDYAGGEETG